MRQAPKPPRSTKTGVHALSTPTNRHAPTEHIPIEFKHQKDQASKPAKQSKARQANKAQHTSDRETDNPQQLAEKNRRGQRYQTPRKKKINKENKMETPEEKKLFPHARQENGRSAKKDRVAPQGRKRTWKGKRRQRKRQRQRHQIPRRKVKGKTAAKRTKWHRVFAVIWVSVSSVGREKSLVTASRNSPTTSSRSVGVQSGHANVRRQHCRSGASAR